MAGAAGQSTYAAVLLLAVMMMVSAVFAAEEAEAEAPSPSMLTGAASMAIVPSVAAVLVGSFVSFFACIFR